MHLHLASLLCMLDKPHEGRDVGAKPEDGRTIQVLGWEILTKRVSPSKH